MKNDDEVLEKNVESLLGQTYDPPRIDPAARARIRAQLLGAATPIKKPSRSRFAWAGGTLIAAAAGIAVFAQLGGHEPVKQPPGGESKVDRNRVELPDGTVAVLGQGGKVERTGDRHVKVTGQVYLDVAPGKTHFVVDTPSGHLEVLGTRFVVEAAPDQTTTAVIRGQVQQRSSDGDALLHAGQQGTMRAGAPPTREPAPRVSHLVGWAQQARIQAEGPMPKKRSGTLYARNPQWQTQDFPLPMRELDVDVVVENQVARVALDQTFHNPRPETLEGVYRLTVPPDAALSRLAMYVDGKLEESAVVERMAARRIYEDIVYKQRDPALAEWTGAGRVDLRVYPLVGGQDKRVIAAYTQPLPRVYDDWTLTVPLPELDDPVDKVGFHVRIADCGQCEIASPSHDVTVTHDGDAAVVSYQKAGERISDSLVLTVRDPGHDARVAEQTSGDWRYLLVRSRPDLTGQPATDYRPRKWVILDDVSASRGALERRAQADLVDRLIDTIDEDDQVMVATMDVEVRRQNDFTRAADLDRHAMHAKLLGERGGVGATDLANAFDDATRALAGTDAKDAYVVYIGDGVVTGGSRDLASLEQKLDGKATFVGFAVGDGSDTPSLGAIADATGGLVVPIDPADDLDWRALDTVATLYTPRVLDLKTRVLDASGAEISGADAYLRSGELAEGDELEIAVRAPAEKQVATVEVSGMRGDRGWTESIEIAGATKIAHAGYAPRLWAQRHIQKMILERTSIPPTDDQRVADREALRKKIVELGKQFFLLSPHTSLIVLENDQMYAEYGIEKGKNDTWAPYATPATIPVTNTGDVSPYADDDSVAIVRTPIQPFYSYSYDRYDNWGAEGQIGTGMGYGPIRAGGGGGTLEGAEVLRGGADLDKTMPDTTVTQQPKSEPMEPETGGDTNGTPVVSTVPATKSVDEPMSRTTTASAAEDSGVLDVVTATEYAQGNKGWSVGRYADGKSNAFAERRKWSGAGMRNEYSPGTYWGGQAYPAAWNYSSDWRLDDLTGFVPAFFASELDDAVAELKAARGGADGSIDDASRKLLDAARTAFPRGTYRWGTGPDISIDASGRMTWDETSDLGLVEHDSFDGTTLVRRYDELGLEVRRELGDASPALLVSMLPILAASPDALAHWYVVKAKDADTITLAPAHAPDAPVLELDFDADHHVIAIRSAAGKEMVTVRWDHGVPVGAAVLGTSQPIEYTTSTIQPPSASSALVTVELPMRAPAYVRNLRAKMAAGSDEWRQATRNLMASLAATTDTSGAVAALRELAANGGIDAGDIVLASGGLSNATTDKDLVDLMSKAGDAPVGRYLSASRAHSRRPKSGQFAALEGDGLIGALAHHRETLTLLEAGKYGKALASLRTSEKGGVLRVVAAAQIAQYSYYDKSVADAWDVVADGAWANVARYESARARYNRGDYAGAASKFVDMMTSYDPGATPVVIDWTAKSAVTSSSRGQVGWELAWSGYRNQILDHGDADEVMALLTGALQIGEQQDMDRIFGRAAELAAGNADATATIVQLALGAGQIDRAAPMLDEALKASPTPSLYRLAAQVAEQQGRVADAADDLDKALAGDGDGPVALSQLRVDMAHLLQLRGRLAALATGAARDSAVDAAIDVADRWRDVDPDDGAIDTQIGEILLTAGRRDEAWRQLSTAVERHPMEGDGWGLVADVMEREGRLDDAIGYWQQAIVIDQTNPTWRMRKAQALLAAGRDQEARTLLKDIASQHWHARWNGVVYQVQQMVQQMK